MIKIANLSIPIDYNTDLLKAVAAERLRISSSRIVSVRIARRSVNLQNKQNIFFNMTLVVGVSGDEEDIVPLRYDDNISKEMKFIYFTKKWNKIRKKPVIVGCGPAGLFAALILAQTGAEPVLLERGLDVDSRRQSVLKFWRTGALDKNTNVQFGEGGAGAFSDGKLKLGARDFRKIKVLSEFVEAGAPPEIMYLDKPHIGTDRLSKAVKNIRQKIISLGGEVRFGATVTKILRENGRVTGIGFLEKEEYSELETDNIILAIGHSARDTFEKLFADGIAMEQRPLAVGVRIEHPQQFIDKIQYGAFAGHPALGAADYKTVVHLKNGRGVYSFCMCPGGTVVAAASEENGVVTNGMSEYARDGENANSAILVTVDKKNYKSDHPLAGVRFQRSIEKAAFAAGGGGYKAPVQRLEDFLCNRKTTAFGSVLPTYLPGTEFSKLDSYMPDYVSESLRQAVAEMDKWMPGFAYPDALLTGAETRSSSPIRILRSESFEAVGLKGLYPCGEGAGYAGGIISAAVDGMRCAEQIINET